MNTKKTTASKKIKLVEIPITVAPVTNAITIPLIAKLESFGNEDMHKLVAKINQIIDAL